MFGWVFLKNNDLRLFGKRPIEESFFLRRVMLKDIRGFK